MTKPLEATDPVRQLPHELDEPDPTTGAGLCLSGGGYRAMLFHTGVIWRLVETGWLAKVDRVSSVSGGSIISARLALSWSVLRPGEPGVVDRYLAEVVEPIRDLARHTIDAWAIAVGLLTAQTIGERVAAAYRARVFGDAKLADLPDGPRFIINATNVGSGALWLFSKEYMGDWRVGRIDTPDVDLAVAVAASSAFPPVLSPYVIEPAAELWRDGPDQDLGAPEHRDQVVLSDGGVYDNLGLETAYKRCRTIFASDAGGQVAPDPRPAKDWGGHIYRVTKVIDNQVRALRKRQLLSAFERDVRDGAYCAIRSDIDHFEAPSKLSCPKEQTRELANVPTRLAAVDEFEQDRLINWGYAIADAALRAHVDKSIDPPSGFPYPAAGVG